MVKNYIPKQGDIISVNLNPIRGHEQQGIRPALVISSNIFNSFTKMALVCPITSNTKIFPTHYELKNTKKIKGSVLCEHIKSIDYESRNIKYIETVTDTDFLNTYFFLLSCFDEKEKLENLLKK